jgi:integrase
LAAIAQSNKGITFQQCAEDYVAAKEAGWRNPKHRAQWRSTLRTYVYPTIGAVPVGAVDTDAVLRCLKPIWLEKTETATRVRGRIEQVLDYAASRSLRSGNNPARWRENLKHSLASKSKALRVKHHPALPWRELPAFMTQLRAEPVVAARALEYTILTAARTVETIGATVDEIKPTERAWDVPASRMKAARAHRVPLSDRALELASASDGHLFPGARAGRGLSNMAMSALLERMGVDVTVHGFRSTFRDWAEEETSHSANVIEMALAHVISDETEAAYRRGDLFEKRRKLMDDWARYCDGGRNVVLLRTA